MSECTRCPYRESVIDADSDKRCPPMADGTDCQEYLVEQAKNNTMEITTLREQLRQAQEHEKATIERSNRARLRAVQSEKERDALKAQLAQAVEIVNELLDARSDERHLSGNYITEKEAWQRDNDAQKVAREFIDGPTAQSAVAEWQAMRDVISVAGDVIEDPQEITVYMLGEALARLDAVRKGEK